MAPYTVHTVHSAFCAHHMLDECQGCVLCAEGTQRIYLGGRLGGGGSKGNLSNRKE